MRSLLIPLIYLILPFVSPSPSPLIPHEHRTHIPSGWSPIRKPNSYALLPLRLALTQPNVHAIETLLLDVSHPHSSNYGNHWSPAQITAKFAPSNHTVDTVRAWLAGSGFAEDRVRVSTSRGWIHINVTVEEAERLLRTEYHVYQHHTGLEHVGESLHSFHTPP
jgi:tripeptidyl-peptidase-1